MSNFSWICCQIGAREHYAIPRAALRLGRPTALITDIWTPVNTGWWKPQRWRQRYHQELKAASVTSSDLSALVLELKIRLTGIRGWSAVMRRNDWFQRAAERQLRPLIAGASGTPVVFSFSYAAKRVLRAAKSLGCKTVLGQIDPGPVEMEIVQRLETESGATKTEWPPKSYWNQWRRECDLADCIVVNSDWSRQALLQKNIPASKIQVVPLAFERDTTVRERQPREIPAAFSDSRPLQILFLGQLISRKGIRELALAIERMGGLPLQWNLVGGGTADTLANLRHLPRTHVPGPVSRIEASQYYQAADVFILPTHSDGYAITQLEAMSFGLPVIASTFCGSVAQHERTGLILPEVSASAIEDAVRRLIREPGLVRQLTEQVGITPVRSLSDLANDLERIEQRLTEGEAQGV